MEVFHKPCLLTHKTWSFSFRISSVNVTSLLRIWPHLLQKSLMENLIFLRMVAFKVIWSKQVSRLKSHKFSNKPIIKNESHSIISTYAATIFTFIYYFYLLVWILRENFLFLLNFLFFFFTPKVCGVQFFINHKISQKWDMLLSQNGGGGGCISWKNVGLVIEASSEKNQWMIESEITFRQKTSIAIYL